MYTVRQRQCFTQGENVELLAQYGLFLAKAATIVVAIAVIAAIIVNLTQRKKQRGELRVTNLSEQYKEMKEELAVALLDGPQQKLWHKAQKKKHKQEAKEAKARAKLGTAEPAAGACLGAGFQRQYGCSRGKRPARRNYGGAGFGDGARPGGGASGKPGGVVHGYGLAASQLQRLRDKQSR